MRYSTVLFDFDGTLNETGPGIFAATRAMMKEFDVPDISESAMRRIVGPPLYTGFRDVLHMDTAVIPAAVARYREIAKTEGIELVHPYPGILELLAALKAQGAMVGIVTAKVHSTAVEQIDYYGFSPYIDYLRGAYSDGNGEKPALLRTALEELQVPRDSVVMIGDRSFDINAAVVNGVDGIGVLYGYGTEKELSDAGAKYIAATVAELGGILLE